MQVLNEIVQFSCSHVSQTEQYSDCPEQHGCTRQTLEKVSSQRVVRYWVVWGLLTRPARTPSLNCSLGTTVFFELCRGPLECHQIPGAFSFLNFILGLFEGDWHFSVRIASDSGRIINSQVSQSIGRDLSTDPPEYGSEVLITRQKPLILLRSQ